MTAPAWTALRLSTLQDYVYTPLRPLEVIRGEIEALEVEVQGMLGKVFA